MVFKSRSETKELKLLRLLNLRTELPVKDAQNYSTLEKGFEGERRFDEYLDSFPNNWLTLHDLQLEYSGNYFQIDTTLQFQENIHLINVKNYEGDYYIEKDGWHSSSDKIIKDPLKQLDRSENLFKQLLHDLGLKFTVESYLIFINPEFHLYNHQRSLPAIFPTQLNRYKDKLLSIPSHLNDRHMRLAKKLVSMHISESPYTQYPKYSYEKCKKGVTCANCHCFIPGFQKHYLICNRCGCIEDVESAVLRCVEELLLLFPERRISVNYVKEWCEIFSGKTIRRILSKNFICVMYSSSTYYVKKEI